MRFNRVKFTKVKQHTTTWLWIALVVLSPTLTEWLESGAFPQHPRELLTDVLITLLLCVLVYLSHLKQTKLIQLSENDSLTGLKNRRKFDVDLALEVKRAQRMGTELLLAFIDVDKFKLVNDRYGHHQGDELLVAIGYLLEHSVRTKIDICYRLGGDEFAILMPVKNSENISDVEHRIFSIEQSSQKEFFKFDTGLSIGLAALKADDNIDTFMKRADQLMYQRKKDEVHAIIKKAMRTEEKNTTPEQGRF